MIDQKPHFCDLIVTESCMLKCKMCRMWQSRNDPAQVETALWKQFIASFADFVSSAAQVQFVGGEPLSRPDTLELVRYASQKGLFTTMTTNAFLIDENLAKEIVGSGLNTLVLSLDSRRPQVHDFLRGQEGVYDRVMGALELFSQASRKSLKIHIVATIMRQNLDDLPEIAEWAQQDGRIDRITFQAVMQPFFTPSDNLWYKKKEFSFLWPQDLDHAEYVLDRLAEFKAGGVKITNPVAQFEAFKSYFQHPERFVKVSRCNLGFNSVSVNTSGKIFLCLSMEPIGDLHGEWDMAKIWFSEKAQRVRAAIKACQNNCKSMINCFFEEESAV